jgi:hypothetical protein
MEQFGQRNKVVARFKDGTSLKGYTHDFTPAKDSFHLTLEGGSPAGEVRVVQVSDLKAVFFVKSLEGDSGYREKKTFREAPDANLQGIKIRVEFEDGEVISGVSLGYNKRKPGFFVLPVDRRSNNERIYVVAAAVKNVTVGDSAAQ